MIDLEYVKAHIKPGWKLNPNDKVVQAIIKRLNKCNGDCPCDNHSEDIHCPCSGYREHNHCCCTLYVLE